MIQKSDTGETVYVNDNYTVRNGDVSSMHIFAGNTRVATLTKTATAEDAMYFYHGDHLGSSNVVTKKTGEFNEYLEYFPYGETWMQEMASESMPYKFTSKEQDLETGLYYFGARYYEPRLSRWISTDPELEKYLPAAGKGSEGLSSMGGVYNSINLNVYNYGGNNPLKYIDPDGRKLYNIVIQGAGINQYVFDHTVILHVNDHSGAMTFYEATGRTFDNVHVWIRDFDANYGTNPSFRDYYGERVPVIRNKNFDPTSSADNYNVVEVKGVNEARVLNHLQAQAARYGPGLERYPYNPWYNNCATFNYNAYRAGGMEFTPDPNNWFENPMRFPYDLNEAIEYHNEFFDFQNQLFENFDYGGSSSSSGGFNFYFGFSSGW